MKPTDLTTPELKELAGEYLRRKRQIHRSKVLKPCHQCGELLGTLERRKPCPKCGATNRKGEQR